MPKNDNVKSIRLYESVRNNIGEEAADSMAEIVYLSKSADFKRKFKWANEVCSYLENNYNDDQIKRIRMGCSCTPPPKYIEAVKKLYQESESLDEFCEKYNAAYGGNHSLWHEGNAVENTAVLFFSYPHCYCDCVQRVDGIVSKTWCLCTLGYTKKLFDAVLECDTEVELIESVKTGGNRCVMSISHKKIMRK
ncbi:MAG: DUF6144 family protein [Eubacteriales bacterium]|nr:DUF6144 family protein [Eubacteriales bacterium]MDD4421656.1 DUF6144 family protein [Eubacteriales bacterium]HBR31440.1 hypothetical protein [Clostridiales bacterium]